LKHHRQMFLLVSLEAQIEKLKTAWVVMIKPL